MIDQIKCKLNHNVTLCRVYNLDTNKSYASYIFKTLDDRLFVHQYSVEEVDEYFLERNRIDLSLGFMYTDDDNNDKGYLFENDVFKLNNEDILYLCRYNYSTQKIIFFQYRSDGEESIKPIVVEDRSKFYDTENISLVGNIYKSIETKYVYDALPNHHIHIDELYSFSNIKLINEILIKEQLFLNNNLKLFKLQLAETENIRVYIHNRTYNVWVFVPVDFLNDGTIYAAFNIGKSIEKLSELVNCGKMDINSYLQKLFTMTVKDKSLNRLSCALCLESRYAGTNVREFVKDSCKEIKDINDIYPSCVYLKML